jgi:hypothetical protein
MFYVTQPFSLIARTLFAGLEPDRASYPRGVALRLCLCPEPEKEVETPIVLTGPTEFQLVVELEPDLVDRWAASSQGWQDRPESIPFGLVLRPLDERSDA